MKRIALTDGSGQWFDYDKATKYEEETFFNGKNHISKATGQQWEHEALYRTAGGIRVVNHWSQWQGSHESYVVIDDKEAAAWFARNEMDPPERLTEETKALEL